MPCLCHAGEQKYVERLESSLKKVRAMMARAGGRGVRAEDPVSARRSHFPQSTQHHARETYAAQARLPQTAIDPLVDALGRSTLGRSELALAISQAMVQVENEKLEVETELRVEKAEAVAAKEKMEKELRVEKAEAVAAKDKMEKELQLEVSKLRGTLKEKETVILRLHGKLSLRGAIGGWVLMSVVNNDAAAAAVAGANVEGDA